jgi:predicted ribosome quality control (RQC) complex YloA/Tae2 family protein
VSEGAGPLELARVQRVDGPRPDLFVLTLHRANLHGCLVLSTAEGRAGVGWILERPRGAPASSFVSLLRKHVEGGRIVSARADDGGAEIVIRRAEIVVALRLVTRRPNLLVALDGRVAAALHPAGIAIGVPYEPLIAGVSLDPSTLDGALVDAAAEGTTRERARILGLTIARRRRQLERRLRAIEADLARVEDVGPLRDRASLLLAHLGTIRSGVSEAIVTNWNVDPPQPLRIAIDPARGPKGEAEALFRRARKLERGAAMALERHSQTEAEIARLDVLASSVASASEDELDRLEREAARLGARAQRAGSAAQAAARRPYRTFRGAGDRVILVGRSAADNDALTLRVARPHDHWLHVRGLAGSHVVVPLERGEICPPELLVDAAHLAASFSDARKEAQVEVQHVQRRHVRKPRGSPPGAVVVTREKVLLLRLDQARLARLLASEDHE